ncbi:hypothetical protein C8F04DRAFT_1206487 [Mycena alexandri]|uniref:Uncharacterized protein n=1 Tax=Mycena alexandri TaxID=1745969 RepID=A0AAD6TKR4_9AGAR|nr:hypothetical protein C8F04DRAFT_1206487 [Mycena alexandri]
MYRLFTTALLAASSVSALTLHSHRISSACQTSLEGVAANSDANACLSVSSLLTIAIQPNSSIITPVDNWLKALCSAAPCSNATLSAIVSNITTGCSAELASADSSETSAANLTPMVEQYYAVARQMVCLTDSGTNCITETLTNIQAILGTLSLSNIGTVIANAFTTTTVPSNITCSNCVKQAYNVLNKDFPSTASSLTSELDSQCGANFTGTNSISIAALKRILPGTTDGTAATGIVESASTTGGKGSSASPLFITQGAVALLVGSSLWAFLA